MSSGKNTCFTNVRERWGRRCDYFIVVGFSIVARRSNLLEFGPKPGDNHKAFVGPPKPVYLVRR